jgi:hypothetical protein
VIPFPPYNNRKLLKDSKHQICFFNLQKITLSPESRKMKVANKKSWAYPVSDWKIIFRYRQKEREWECDFYSISHFSNYLRDVPEQALLIGYGKELPQHRLRQNFIPCSDGKLMLWYIESSKEFCYEFKTVRDFAHFLNNHETIAKALSFVKKANA